jgi:virginiamycin B lyase
MPLEKADDPHTAVFDSRGPLWFTVQGGNMVGRLDPKSGKIELKNVPTKNALSYGIAINRALINGQNRPSNDGDQ